MLALETGWTPDVIGSLPEPFRRACHWALYARAVAGPDGLPEQPPLASLPLHQRADGLRRHQSIEAARARLFPEGD